MSDKRAERRRHLARMKAKARKFYPESGKRAEQWADYLCVCSCHMCRTPRHSGYCKSRNQKLTLQEQKSEMELREQVQGLHQGREEL